MWEALPSSSSNPYRITVFSIKSIMPSMICLHFESTKKQSPICNIVLIKAVYACIYTSASHSYPIVSLFPAPDKI